MIKEANTMQRIPIYRESTTCGKEKIGLMRNDDDFEKAYASAITEDELKQRLYQRIDAWKWNEK